MVRSRAHSTTNEPEPAPATVVGELDSDTPQ